MAFRKFAKANIIKPDINMPVWDKVLHSSDSVLGSAFTSREASKITLAEFSPKTHLLTHCTIVASVDTENGPGKLGRATEGSEVIDRRFQDYYITPETTPYVNSNEDSWERKLLLASFRTFIGGDNFVEHLQVPEMSKGKVIDAAARDIGDSIYIDILVATHRKFKPLVASIQSGEMSTLSMGATVKFTICSKCGNVAVDDTQLCTHIRFQKGNSFIDELGKTRKIAELCGHLEEEPGSNKFIEASWVANPAFKGAVLRSIFSEAEAGSYAASNKEKLSVAFSTSVRNVNPEMLRLKAAKLETPKFSFDFGQGEEEEVPVKAPEDPMETAISEVAEMIRSKALQRVRDEMSSKKDVPYDTDENENDTLIKEASLDPHWRRVASAILQKTDRDPAQTRRLLLGLLHHEKGGWDAVRKASAEFSGPEILAISHLLDTLEGAPRTAGASRVYRTVLAVGGAAAYSNTESYLAACRQELGRQLTNTEVKALISKGKLFDLGR